MYIFFATRTFLNFTVNHKRMNRCPRRWKSRGGARTMTPIFFMNPPMQARRMRDD